MRLSPWLTSRLSTPSAAASAGTWSRRRRCARRPASGVREVPDEAEVAKARTPTRTRRRRPMAAQPFEGAVDPPVEGGDGRSEGAPSGRRGRRRDRWCVAVGASDEVRRHAPAAPTSRRVAGVGRLRLGAFGVATEARAPRLVPARGAAGAGPRAGTRRWRRPVPRLPTPRAARVVMNFTDCVDGTASIVSPLLRYISRITAGPATEDLFAQERVEVHAGQALLLPVQRRSATGLVVRHDQLAVAQLEAVDDAAQRQRPDGSAEAQLETDRLHRPRVLHREVPVDQHPALVVERGDRVVVEPESDEVRVAAELLAGDIEALVEAVGGALRRRSRERQLQRHGGRASHAWHGSRERRRGAGCWRTGRPAGTR